MRFAHAHWSPVLKLLFSVFFSPGDGSIAKCVAKAEMSDNR